MAVNDVYENSTDSLASGNSLIIDGTGAGTGAVEVFEMGATNDVTVYKETDVDGDNTYEVSVQIDSQSGTWHTQKNQLVASDSNNHRLRLENSSGTTINNIFATGMEVND